MSDIMLHGVLNMPPELWIGTPIDVMQRHSRYIQASEYIKELTEQRDRLAKACDQYSEDESLCKLHEVTEQRDRLVEVLTSIMPIFNFKYLSHEEKQKVRYASEVIAVIKGGNNE